MSPAEYPPPGAYGTPPPAYGTPPPRRRFYSGVNDVVYRLVQLIWIVAGLVVVILALDFIFHLFRAANTGFGAFIYGIADPLASPFDNVFGQTAVRGANMARWGDLLAIVVYSVAAWALARIVALGATTRTAAPPPM